MLLGLHPIAQLLRRRGVTLSVQIAGDTFVVTGSPSSLTYDTGSGPVTITLTAGQQAELQTEGMTFVGAPSVTGTAEAGSALTAVAPIVVFDVADGVPALTAEWLEAGSVVHTGGTYTLDSDSMTLGVTLRLSAINGGEGSITAEVAAYTPPAFVEEAATPGATTYLTSPAVLATSPQTQSLLFASAIIPTASQRVLIQDVTSNAENYLIFRDPAKLATRGGDNAASGMDFPDSETGLTTEARGNILLATDTTVPQTGGVTGAVRGPLGWVYRDGFRVTTQIPLDAIQLLRNGSSANYWGVPVYRVAMWYGSFPDLSASATQNLFVQSDGSLHDPALSVSAYGDPIFDFHTLAHWQTGNHAGTLGNFTVNGSFT